MSDTYKIYQLHDTPEYHGIRFSSMEENRNENLSIKDYDLVYQGDISDFSSDNLLEGIYRKFNLDRPEDFRGHSLSMSDVVVMEINNEQKAYYCDRIGFQEMPEFFAGQSKWIDYSANYDMKIDDEYIEGLTGKENLLANGGVFFRETERKNEFEYAAVIIEDNNTPFPCHGYINLDEYRDDEDFIQYAEEEKMTVDELINTGAFAASWVLENNTDEFVFTADRDKDAGQFIDEMGLLTDTNEKENSFKAMAYDYRQEAVAGLESLIRERKDDLLEKLNVESLDSIPDKMIRQHTLQYELDRQISNTENAEIKKALLGGGLDDKDRVSAILSFSEEHSDVIADVLQNYSKYGSVDWELNLGSDFDVSLKQIDSLLRERFVYTEEAVVRQALDNVIKSPDKQIAEFQNIELPDGEYRYENESYQSEYAAKIDQTLYDLFSEEETLGKIADYVTENGYSLTDDIVKAEEMVWDYLHEEILKDKKDNDVLYCLPLATDEEILLDFKEAMSNSYLDEYYKEGFQLSDFFDKDEENEANYYVKQCYAQAKAINQLDCGYTVDEIAEKVQELLEQREQEAEIEIGGVW